jgi:hypothetical protein
MNCVSAYAKKDEEERVEPLSILNPPVTDILNDPRVTSLALLKMIDEQQTAITTQVAELAAKVKPGDITPFDAMIFAYLQHHLHVTILNAKLTARTMDLTYGNHQLNLGLDRLTKWLIGLTIVLGLFALPLAIDVVTRWFK